MNSNNNAEDILGLLNRLPALLRWAGMKNFGSNLHFTYVAPSAQYVHHIDTQIFGERSLQKPTKSTAANNTRTPLPPELATEAAMVLWKKVQAAGYVNANYQPLISRTQAALLADTMAERLGIKEKWKVFETFWNRNNMRGDYTRAMNQRQSLGFQDKLKRLFSSDIE